MKVAGNRNRVEGPNPKYYFNTVSGVGDFFKCMKIFTRDINNLAYIDSLNQVSLVIFFVVSHRNMDNMRTHLYTVLKNINLIDIRDIRYKYDNYLDKESKSIMLIYLTQAVKELTYWHDLDDNSYNILMDFLTDVSHKIIN